MKVSSLPNSSFDENFEVVVHHKIFMEFWPKTKPEHKEEIKKLLKEALVEAGQIVEKVLEGNSGNGALKTFESKINELKKLKGELEIYSDDDA